MAAWGPRRHAWRARWGRFGTARPGGAAGWRAVVRATLRGGGWALRGDDRLAFLRRASEVESLEDAGEFLGVLMVGAVGDQLNCSCEEFAAVANVSRCSREGVEALKKRLKPRAMLLD